MTVNRMQFDIVEHVNSNPENAIVILGNALNGPSHTPISVDKEVDPKEVFGESPLADAYSAVRDSGANQIIAYRLNGFHAEASIKKLTSSPAEEVLRFTSISAGLEYNDIKVNIFSDYIHIDETPIGGKSRVYDFSKYPRAYDLAYAINRDARYGLLSFTARAIRPDTLLNTLVADNALVMFSKGHDEADLIYDRNISINPVSIHEVMKERLETALFGTDPVDQSEFQPNSLLGMMSFGVIVLADMFYDDDSYYAESLGSFCMNKTKYGEMGCIGVIGVEPFSMSISEDESIYVNNLTTLAGGRAYEEYMEYIQVIVGESKHRQEDRVISAAYAYAGSQAALPYYAIMSNKGIAGINQLSRTLSKEKIDSLTANGYTCIVPSIRRGTVAYSARTFTTEDAPMSKPHCVRIAQNVAQVLSREFDSLVGSAVTFLNKKDIESKAHEIMKELVSGGILKGYALSFTYSEGNKNVTVEAAITPFSEITKIKTITSVGFTREVVE